MDNPSTRIYVGDARQRLRELPDESVHCCVCSPPYWGARSYSDDPAMIGMESTWDEHKANILDVFREVRRVLRPDGTMWLNYGDGYWGGKGASNNTKDYFQSRTDAPKATHADQHVTRHGQTRPTDRRDQAWKPKDLIMKPDRLAIAMFDDGWWVRSRITWHKTNSRPEPSAHDRPDVADEAIFLLTKSHRYFYNKESVNDTSNVWAFPTARHEGSHTAVMPEPVAARCITLGCPQNGVVLDCFGGVGTTALAANRLGRDAIMIELDIDTAEDARQRLLTDQGMFADVAYV